MLHRAAISIAWRELRAGVRGFRVLLICLALGVASVAAIGTVRSSIEAGLTEQGAAILGGDAEIELSYRFAREDELDWLRSHAQQISETVEFRSMAVTQTGDETVRALTQLKGVDGNYPLYGEVRLEPPIPFAEAVFTGEGENGAVMHGDLISRLGLSIGDKFSLGLTSYRLTARLVAEPDGINAGFALGPRTIIDSGSLADSGLIGPGTLYSTQYRMRLYPDTDLNSLRSDAEASLADSGLQWTDRRDGSPSARAFVQRVGAFLVLIGLAGIAVGGIGVSAAVRAFLESKTATIATLKTLGAERSTILFVYLLQVGAMIALGTLIGLLIGIILPWLFNPLIAAYLPVPTTGGFSLRPLAEAALYGCLAGFAFSLWSLASTDRIKAAELYRRSSGRGGLPPPGMLSVIFVIAAALIGSAAWLSGVPQIALWAAGGLLASLVAFGLASLAVRQLSRGIAGSGLIRGMTGLRLAFGSIGGPNSDAAPVMLSLGLGLTVLAAVGQIAVNLNNSITRDIPEIAPSYFVIDIQNDQFGEFTELVQTHPGVTDLQSAPMLRGVITQINGAPAEEVAGGHWVLRGDRGVSYSAEPPEDAVITEGEWWPADYTGTPLVSFADEEAREMGLRIGDRLTVNILGRDLEVTIANFREVEFETLGIGFIMIMDPNVLADAPHTHIATLYAEAEAEDRLFLRITSAFPNVTAISVQEGIDRIRSILNGLAAAISYGSGVTLATGLVVLIGAAAAAEKRRIYESAILKTLGASRRRILMSLALRSAILGAAAGAVAIIAGGIAGWAVLKYVMRMEYGFEPVSAAAVVSGGVLLSLGAGLLFALGPLNASPSRILRAPD
ncbi:MAG: drug:proton antiporter [Rhodobacteraceae bacterium]|nr:drug:proton antiporter [Paracoccaceae bacterium]